MKKPNLFIVGASKSGTTALYHFLKQHPDIFMSDHKEPRFFCKDIVQETDLFYKDNRGTFHRYGRYEFQIRTEKDYLNLFANWKTEKMSGEASTRYLDSKVAAREIHKFKPNAKIIIMLRNPVDRMYSRYSQRFWTGTETAKDFKTAILFDKRGYFEHDNFSEKIKRYYDVFDKKQIKIIIFDDFKKDNVKVYREVLQFLGVYPNFTPNFNLVNANKTPRFRNFHIWLKFSPIAKAFILPKFILPKRISTVYWKIIRAVRFIYVHIFVVRQTRPPMDLELRKELMKKFKPEIGRLSELLNRDFITLWGYDDIKENK